MSFSYTSANGNNSVKCNLECRQCDAQRKGGGRCKRTTCKMLPFCSQHTKSELGVEIKKSTIPRAGSGLFALQNFCKGQKIAPYTGKIINDRQKAKMYGHSKNDLAPYGVHMFRDQNMDAACTRGIGGFSNTLPNKNNSKLVVNGRLKTVSIKASKAIKRGAEIFTSYGASYWAKPNSAPKPTYGTTPRKTKNETPIPSKRPKKRARH